MSSIHYQSLMLSLGQNGLSLHVEEWGNGSDACILLHGFGEGAYIWNSFAPSIAKLFRTLAIDLRGHGDSSWDTKGEYHVERYAADVLNAIDILGVKRFVLVGHSLGGETAIRIAAARPESIIGLVIVDFGPDTNEEGSDRVLSDFNDSQRNWDSLSEYEKWLQERRPLVGIRQIRDLAVGALRSQPAGGYRPKCDPVLGTVEKPKRDAAMLWKLIATIRSPVLILRGLGSAVLTHAVAERMEKTLRSGKLSTIAGAGHAVVSDNPDGFADQLFPFLSQLCLNGAPPATVVQLSSAAGQSEAQKSLC